LLDKEIWYTKARNIDVFKKTENGYQTQFSINNVSDEAGTGESIRLTFNQSSLQDVYPKLYTMALSTDSKLGKLIPNEPYIPFAEDIELNYSAKEEVYSYLIKDSEGAALKSKEVQFYHEDVFGQYEKDVKTQHIVP
ncbi:hypothetical protein AB4Y90_18270, partial [Chryseobacterium sp. 2TAF14]